MPYLLSVANSTDAASLPLAAFHACRYSDWTDAAVCRWPRQAVMASMPEAARNRAIASFSLPLLPRWTIADTHGAGAAAYRQAAPTPAPVFEPWQAACLEAARRLRRWRYYATDALPQAAPAQALDGCRCRVCLTR